MDQKLAELNMTAHRDLLLQHTNQVHSDLNKLSRVLIVRPQFIAKALEICEPNLRINGRNFEEYEGEEEGTQSCILCVSRDSLMA